MDRSIFPEGVEVHQSALANVGEQAAFHIQRRLADSIRSGRVSGLEVSIGSPETRFVVTGGWGYTPRGDYVEVDGVDKLPLADYTDGVENLIVLCYRETVGTPEAHEDGGSTRNTIATRSSELKVITRAEYNALPEYDDADFATDLKVADLSTDARSRMVVIATIIGKGVGVNYNGTPASVSAAATFDFLNGNINQQQALTVMLTAELPTDPAIPGVNIKRLTANTRVGSGKLRLNTAGTQWRLSWSSPNSLGVSVDPSDTGGVVFSSSPNPQVFTIASETVGETSSSITVEVMTDFFPASVAPFIDAVTVDYLYDNDGPVFSSIDALHRSKLGSYVPRQADPHGTGYTDLAQPVSIIPKPLVVGTDLMATEAQALMARFTSNRSSFPGVTRTLIWQCAGGDNGTIRAYALTSGGYELCTNAKWDGSVWNKDTTFASYLWRFDGGFTEYQNISTTGTWADTAWDNLTMVNKGTLTLGSALLANTSNEQFPRIQVDRPDGSYGHVRTRLLLSESAGGPNYPLSVYLTTHIPDYAFVVDGSEPAIEFTLNAQWDGTARWTRIISGQPMARVAVSKHGFTVMTDDASSTLPSLGDYTTAITSDGWEVMFSVNKGANGGVHILSGELQLGSALTIGVAGISTSQVAVPRIKTFANPSGVLSNSPNTRWLISEIWIGGGTLAFRKYVYSDNSTFFYEEAIGCRWVTDHWYQDTDTQGSSVLYRYQGGIKVFYKAGTGNQNTPWTDDVGGPGWTRVASNLDSSALSINDVGAGPQVFLDSFGLTVTNASFGATAGLVLPNAILSPSQGLRLGPSLDTILRGDGGGLQLLNSSDAFPAVNKLYGDNMPKAWGRINVTRAGGAIALVTGFNVSGVATIGPSDIGAGNNRTMCQVSLFTGLSSTNYVVIPSINGSWDSGDGVTSVVSRDYTTSSFNLLLVKGDGNAVNLDGTSGDGYDGPGPSFGVNFVVFGRQ